MRQKWAKIERDAETGLDYAQARYYSSTQGRFTSPDPLLASGKHGLPQSWNRYTYCLNNPLAYIDPSGLQWYSKNGGDGRPEWFDDNPGDGYTQFTQYSYYAGEGHGYVALDPFSNSYQTGFESSEDAAGYSRQLAGETMQALDPGQYVSQVDGTLEMAGYISGVTGLARIGARALAAGATETALTHTAATATAQVVLNRAAGKAAERLVAGQLVAEGNTILGSQVGARTAQGLRFIDHLIQTPAGQVIAIEVKSGGATRSAAQLAKDSLMASEGAVIVGKNAPAALRGQTLVIQTIERVVPR